MNETVTFFIDTYGWTYTDHFKASGSGTLQSALEALGKSHLSPRRDEARRQVEATGRYSVSVEGRGGSCTASIHANTTTPAL